MPLSSLTPDRAAPVRTVGVGGGQVVALALLAGLLSGALTSFAQTVLPGPFGGLANAVAPWLVVPFAVGALARRWPWALVAGVVACAAQVGGYYVTADLRGFAVGTTWVVFWLVAALSGGAVAGAAGCSWWRVGDAGATEGRVRRERGAGAAVLVAAWLAEAVVVYAVVLHYPGHAAVFAATGLVAFVLLGLRGGQHARVARWLGPAFVLGCAGFALLHAV